LAHKYYGPFLVIGKHPNAVNYIIQRINSKKSKKIMIHKNRLKLYFGHYLDYVATSDRSIIEDMQSPIRMRQERVAGSTNNVCPSGGDSPCLAEPSQGSSVPYPALSGGTASQQVDPNIVGAGEAGVAFEESEAHVDKDFSFRPYYNKMTDQEMTMRRSSRPRKQPDRFAPT
jgi:hypothetical protein